MSSGAHSRRIRALKRLHQALWKLLRSPGDWVILARAQAAILRARARVRDEPRGSLVPSLNDEYREDPAPPSESVHIAEQIGLAVDRVARFGFGRPLCLVRSIAIQDLLARAGIRGALLRVGVRVTPSHGFEAHAWVELHGCVVGDDPEYVASFDPISDLEQIAETSWASTTAGA